MLTKWIFVLINGKPDVAYSGLGGSIFVKGLVNSAPLNCKQRLGLQGQIFSPAVHRGICWKYTLYKYVLYEFEFV